MNRHQNENDDDGCFIFSYLVLLYGGIIVLFLLLDWGWRTFVAPLHLPWFVEVGLILGAAIGIYAWTIHSVARGKIPTRIYDVRQKVKGDITFLAIYGLLSGIGVFLICWIGGALDSFARFYTAALLLGVVAKLRGVLKGDE